MLADGSWRWQRHLLPSQRALDAQRGGTGSAGSTLNLCLSEIRSVLRTSSVRACM